MVTFFLKNTIFNFCITIKMLESFQKFKCGSFLKKFKDHLINNSHLLEKNLMIDIIFQSYLQ